MGPCVPCAAVWLEKNKATALTTFAVVRHSHSQHIPSVRVPSKHDELDKQVPPETAVFVHDVPEGSVTEQSPTVSALGRSSDASQFAKMGGD
jgi:hypothetical protein